MEDDDDDLGDHLQGFMPASFGKADKGVDVDAQIERARRSVASENKKDSDQRSDDSPNGSDSDSDDEDEDDEFPTTHELVFKTQDRAVTTITVDPSGSRMITGSTDCTLKLHDFASLTPNTLRAFKSVDPTATKTSASSETHPIHVAKFNPNSPSQLLVISATTQAKLLDRDGETTAEFNKGDMYLRDMHMTKGHISEITSGTWHPTNWDLFVTAGTDSTLRIWDVKTRMKQKDVIVHKSKAAGSAGRTRMTAVAWGSSAEGSSARLAAAALDGSLLLWAGHGPYNRPTSEIPNAHERDTWTSGIDISRHNQGLGHPEIQEPSEHRAAFLNIEPIPDVQHPILAQRLLDHYRFCHRRSPHSESRNPATRTDHAHHSWLAADLGPVARKAQPDRDWLSKRRDACAFQS